MDKKIQKNISYQESKTLFNLIYKTNSIKDFASKLLNLKNIDFNQTIFFNGLEGNYLSHLSNIIYTSHIMSYSKDLSLLKSRVGIYKKILKSNFNLISYKSNFSKNSNTNLVLDLSIIGAESFRGEVDDKIFSSVDDIFKSKVVKNNRLDINNFQSNLEALEKLPFNSDVSYIAFYNIAFFYLNAFSVKNESHLDLIDMFLDKQKLFLNNILEDKNISMEDVKNIFIPISRPKSNRKRDVLLSCQNFIFTNGNLSQINTYFENCIDLMIFKNKLYNEKINDRVVKYGEQDKLVSNYADLEKRLMETYFSSLMNKNNQYEKANFVLNDNVREKLSQYIDDKNDFIVPGGCYRSEIENSLLKNQFDKSKDVKTKNKRVML